MSNEASQNNTTNPTPNVPVPWFVAEAGRTTDPTSKKQKVLLYGEDGTGKTLFLSSWPKPAMFAFEDGTKTLESRGMDIPVFRFGKDDIRKGRKIYAEVMHGLDLFKHKEGPFAAGAKFGDILTLGFDTWTGLVALLRDEAMYEDGNRSATRDAADWSDYGKVSARMESILDFIQGIDCFFVGTAHLGYHEVQGSSRLQPMPEVLGSSRTKLRHAFDEMYYFHKREEGGKVLYEAYTSIWRGFPAKSRTEGVPYHVIWDGYPTYEQLYGDWKQYAGNAT